MNYGSEGLIIMYKLYGGMRNVQVMRKGVKNPDEEGEPTCNLDISLAPNTKWSEDVHCFLTSDCDDERSIPIISNGSGSPPFRPFLGNLYPSSLLFPFVSVEVLVDRR